MVLVHEFRPVLDLLEQVHVFLVSSCIAFVDIVSVPVSVFTAKYAFGDPSRRVR